MEIVAWIVGVAVAGGAEQVASCTALQT